MEATEKRSSLWSIRCRTVLRSLHFQQALQVLLGISCGFCVGTSGYFWLLRKCKIKNVVISPFYKLPVVGLEAWWPRRGELRQGRSEKAEPITRVRASFVPGPGQAEGGAGVLGAGSELQAASLTHTLGTSTWHPPVGKPRAHTREPAESDSTGHVFRRGAVQVS